MYYTELITNTSHLPKLPHLNLFLVHAHRHKPPNFRQLAITNLRTHSIETRLARHKTENGRERNAVAMRLAKIERTQRGSFQPPFTLPSPLDFSRSQKSVGVILSPGNRSVSVCIIRCYGWRGEEQRWEG